MAINQQLQIGIPIHYVTLVIKLWLSSFYLGHSGWSNASDSKVKELFHESDRRLTIHYLFFYMWDCYEVDGLLK